MDMYCTFQARRDHNDAPEKVVLQQQCLTKVLEVQIHCVEDGHIMVAVNLCIVYISLMQDLV